MDVRARALGGRRRRAARRRADADELPPRRASSSWRTSALHAVVRCGDVGQNGNGGHAHNDTLSFELSLDGRPLRPRLGDLRLHVRPAGAERVPGTAAHSTVVVAGEEINPIDPTRLFELEQASTPKVTHVGRRAPRVAMHDGYRRLATPTCPPAQLRARRRAAGRRGRAPGDRPAGRRCVPPPGAGRGRRRRGRRATTRSRTADRPAAVALDPRGRLGRPSRAAGSRRRFGVARAGARASAHVSRATCRYGSRARSNRSKEKREPGARRRLRRRHLRPVARRARLEGGALADRARLPRAADRVPLRDPLDGAPRGAGRRGRRGPDGDARARLARRPAAHAALGLGRDPPHAGARLPRAQRPRGAGRVGRREDAARSARLRRARAVRRGRPGRRRRRDPASREAGAARCEGVPARRAVRWCVTRTAS